ncbi:MAG: hypothetical protein IPF69_12935 [Chitinophagaceae bacterium]|nr:hypothetical protein [Chitinophagaceae bacterium]
MKKKQSYPFNESASPTFDFAQLKNFHGLYSKAEVKNYIPVQNLILNFMIFFPSLPVIRN